jgi:hypothetical protein
MSTCGAVLRWHVSVLYASVFIREDRKTVRLSFVTVERARLGVMVLRVDPIIGRETTASSIRFLDDVNN